jgi:hypothetical protein
MPTGQVASFTEQEYREKVPPRLAGIKLAALKSALGISRPYAINIRSGRRIPHPRHWETLAALSGVP